MRWGSLLRPPEFTTPALSGQALSPRTFFPIWRRPAVGLREHVASLAGQDSVPGGNISRGREPRGAAQVESADGKAQAPQPPLPVWEPRYLDGGVFPFRCAVTGELDMSTWREDALKGAALGALIFLGVALLLGVAAWLFR